MLSTHIQGPWLTLSPFMTENDIILMYERLILAPEQCEKLVINCSETEGGKNA